ncbi:MAG: hypothetical protein E7582_00840 [Ruminococcaceae bacterium]|nr:hypothetical protein [Oscillospiraceae bacterium]
MNTTKRILVITMAFVFLFGAMSVLAYAKTYTTYSKRLSNSAGYVSTSFDGQNCIEKYVAVNKKDTLKIYPTTSLTSNKLKSYVRYVVWVYDINTNKRIVNKICKSGECVTYKNNTKGTLHLSVQVRPYLTDKAFSVSNLATINAFVKSVSFKFKCTGISKY